MDRLTAAFSPRGKSLDIKREEQPKPIAEEPPLPQKSDHQQPADALTTEHNTSKPQEHTSQAQGQESTAVPKAQDLAQAKPEDGNVTETQTSATKPPQSQTQS